MKGNKILNQLSLQRINDVSKGLAKTKKFKRIEKARGDLQESIEKLLPAEKKKLINEMDEYVGELMALHEDYFYMCGFQDGCSIIDYVLEVSSLKSHSCMNDIKGVL